MDKDRESEPQHFDRKSVSTLVLMDSWIKTNSGSTSHPVGTSFNPCFNGFMDKDDKAMPDVV